MVYKGFAKDKDSLTQLVSELVAKYGVVKIEVKDGFYEVKAWRRRGW